MEAINEFAFVHSEYPVILSIENHCKRNPALIKRMATIFTLTFGDKLVKAPFDDIPVSLSCSLVFPPSSFLPSLPLSLPPPSLSPLQQAGYWSECRSSSLSSSGSHVEVRSCSVSDHTCLQAIPTTRRGSEVHVCIILCITSPSSCPIGPGWW